MPALGSLTLLWPSMLWLLTVLPILILVYWWMLAKRRQSAARFANLETVWQVAANANLGLGGVGAEGKSGSRGGIGNSFAMRLRNHLPAFLLLLALASWLFAISRPQAALMLPSHVENIILAMDMSGSMRANDLLPSRLVAAQKAAKTFIADQPAHTRIGVVAIAAAAAVVQSPTENREELIESIDRLQPQRGTALGSGLIISLATLLPASGIDVDGFINNPRNRANPSDPNRRADPQIRDPNREPGRDANQSSSKPSLPKPDPVPPGSNSSAAIVLLSDGLSNVGPDPIKAAEIAADYGVRVFTVGIGTTEGTSLTVDGWTSRVRLDEEALQKIAAVTHAEYFRAGNANELKKIYQYLSARLTLEKKTPTEVTSLFIGFGAALAMLAALLSMWWFNRVL
jgi:Ca-activated chloride channel homolog